MEKKRIFQAAIGAAAAAALTGLDQFTKHLARTLLSGKPGISVLPGVFELFYLENRGAAFGMLKNSQWFFVTVAVLMMLAVACIYLRLPAGRHYCPLRIKCVLIFSGAAGNMLDRLIHHYVTDFLYVSLIDFPVFNVADCYVCVGAAAAVLLLFTVYRKDDFAFLLSGPQ